jgi:DNA-binding IclR family transcriptional regulator
MATAPRQQAAQSRAPGPRRKAAAERSASDDGQAMEEQQGRARSTTGDLLNLIEQLSNFDQVGVTRLARHLGVPVPTAYRMLRALERAGYVEQLAESKEYRLTLKLFELDVLYLAQVKTEELLAVNLTPGSRAPATCTAMGKAMLAADFRMARSIVGPGPYPRRTEYSLTSYEELFTELAEIRRLGYAVDRQELNLGVWCVAAPIPGGRQTQPAAVSVSAYRSHLDAAEEERLGKLVIAAASRIYDRLGGLGNMVSC